MWLLYQVYRYKTCPSLPKVLLASTGLDIHRPNSPPGKVFLPWTDLTSDLVPILTSLFKVTLLLYLQSHLAFYHLKGDKVKYSRYSWSDRIKDWDLYWDMIAMFFLLLVYWNIITQVPNFRNPPNQQYESTFEMGVPNTRLLVVIGTSLINLSAMQASKQANTEQTIICLAMLGHNGERRQDLVFIQGIHMSLRNSYLSRKKTWN